MEGNWMEPPGETTTLDVLIHCILISGIRNIAGKE